MCIICSISVIRSCNMYNNNKIHILCIMDLHSIYFYLVLYKYTPLSYIFYFYNQTLISIYNLSAKS